MATKQFNFPATAIYFYILHLPFYILYLIPGFSVFLKIDF